MISYISMSWCCGYDGLQGGSITPGKKQEYGILKIWSSEQVFTGFRYTSSGIILYHKAEANRFLEVSKKNSYPTWLRYELSWVRVVLGTSCSGYELSWVRVVLLTSWLGYEWSWVRVVLGASHLGYELSRSLLYTSLKVAPMNMLSNTDVNLEEAF